MQYSVSPNNSLTFAKKGSKAKFKEFHELILHIFAIQVQK